MLAQSRTRFAMVLGTVVLLMGLLSPTTASAQVPRIQDFQVTEAVSYTYGSGLGRVLGLEDRTNLLRKDNQSLVFNENYLDQFWQFSELSGVLPLARVIADDYIIRDNWRGFHAVYRYPGTTIDQINHVIIIPADLSIWIFIVQNNSEPLEASDIINDTTELSDWAEPPPGWDAERLTPDS